MKAKSMVIPLAVLLLVLASSVAPAEAEGAEKVPIPPTYPWKTYDYPYLRIEGWLIRVYGEEETPQGIKWHLSILVQFDVVDERPEPDEYVGKGRHKFTYNGLRVDGQEDYMEEQNAVVNIPGPDMQGIERRKKILTVIVDGVIKVDVLIDIVEFA